MTSLRLSLFAVLAGTALLSTGCATPGSVPWQASCSPPCASGFVCAGTNRCVPANNSGSGNAANGGGGNYANGGGNTASGGGGNYANGGGGSGGSQTGTGGSGTAGSGSGTGGSNQGTGGQTGMGGSSGFGGGSSGSGTGGSGFGGGSNGNGTGGSGFGGGSSGGGTNYCGSCSSDADCGGGNNFCLAFSFGNYCGTDCSAGQQCPSGASCQQIGDGSGNVVGSNCVPNGTDCSGNPTGGSTGGGGSGGGSGSGTGGSGSGSCTTDTWSSFGASFFQSECANCHGSMGSQSGVQSQLGSIASSIQGDRCRPVGSPAARKAASSPT